MNEFTKAEHKIFKKTWYLDTTQIKDEKIMREEITRFLSAANKKEPKIIHEIIYVE